MIDKYFKDFDKKIIAKSKTAAKDSSKKGDAKSGAGKTIDLKMLKEALSGIIPVGLIVESVKPIDSTGFSPECVDLVAYKEYCPDIIKLMDGYVPCELIYGLYHIIQNFNKDSLVDILNKVITAKKLNRYSANPDEMQQNHIPSFVIAASTNYQFNDLKNDIVNYYLSKNIEYQFEIDILVILQKGIVVKNWREKRSFIALETKEDTTMWFYILMNEYLDVNKDITVDFRKYIAKDVVYNEY